MERQFTVLDVCLIRFGRAFADGTVAERKARRDAEHAMLDQAKEALEAAGTVFRDDGGFHIGEKDMPVKLDLDTPSIAILAQLVETAHWPSVVNQMEDSILDLRDAMQLWLKDAQEEDQYNRLPEATRKRMAEKAAREAKKGAKSNGAES